MLNGRAAEWFGSHTSRAEQWPLQDLLDAKAAHGSVVSVVVAAKDEEQTIGLVVQRLHDSLRMRTGLIDELVVIDSDSSDSTAVIAADAGARVFASSDIRPDLGTQPGKGEALWKSLFVTTGDVVVFIDADVLTVSPHYVIGLLGPLLMDPGIALVKAFYDRINVLETGEAHLDGGRVTELCARPLLNMWWPDLAGVIQPLAGEWAIRREVIERLSMPTDYGVELATLIDVYREHGLESIAQVDLGERVHRHQGLRALSLMSAELLLVATQRLDWPSLPAAPRMSHYVRSAPGERGTWQGSTVPTRARPPAVDVPPGALTHVEASC